MNIFSTGSAHGMSEDFPNGINAQHISTGSPYQKGSPLYKKGYSYKYVLTCAI